MMTVSFNLVLAAAMWVVAAASVVANRVQFSTGHDITLSPKQDGPALNYFVYPYVEVDGKPDDNLEKQFSFEEVNASR